MTTQANKPAALIRADLANLRQQQASLHRVPLAPLHARLARATTQALLDINLRGEVVNAQHAIEHAEAESARYAELQGAIVVLERDLVEAEFAERLIHIREADQQSARMANDYDSACRVVCRLYEAMVDQHAILSRTTPGWHAPQLPSFDFSHMTPSGWQGVTSEHIASGALAWLNSEKARAA